MTIITKVRKNLKKKKVGVVLSNKMNKTVVVKVERVMSHDLYRKVYSTHKTFKAHDENNECNIGDKVLIVETKPISKDKRWRVAEIISKNK